MFNTVEGNSSFYALPEVEYVQRWAREALPGFRFCFKFPRLISHEHKLVAAEEATKRFLEILEILADAERLGVTFLQLGPDFSADAFGVLEHYLRALPSEMSWAVELRHLSWYTGDDAEKRVNDLLGELGMDRVLFDSRALFQKPPDDEIEKKSQARKPKTPLRKTCTGENPFVRFVGRNNTELAAAFLEEWGETICHWVLEGKTPFLFAHAPDDARAPELAKLWYQKIRTRLIAAGMPQEQLPTQLPSLPEPPKQLQLDF